LYFTTVTLLAMLPMRSLCRLAASIPLRPQVRRIHIDTARMGQEEQTEILSDMISSGTHSSTERITRFMNAVYVSKPRAVSLFSFNFRQQTERSTIRGVCIGTNGRRGGSHKNVVVVSGLPLQDPSLIGVGLYVAAMLARTSPMLPRDVSVIPLAYPKEYESRWRSPRFGDPRASSSSVSPLFDREASNWLAHENVTLELQDTSKPLETYITRKNKYFVNIDVNLTTRGSGMQYRSNSLPQLAAKGKHRTFLMEQSPLSIPLPSSVAPLSASSLFPEQGDLFIAPLLESPSLVLELKGTQPLDDEQVVARGEEVIKMVKELLLE